MEHYTDETPRMILPEDGRPGTYRSPIRGQYIHESHEAPRRLREAPGRSFRETLLRQCTICGILLAAVLFMNVADTRATNGAMAWLRQTLSADSNAAGQAISALWDAVRGTIIGEEPAAPAAPDAIPVIPVATMPPPKPADITQTDIGEPLHDAVPINADRIDEDILDSIINTPDLYNPKN